MARRMSEIIDKCTLEDFRTAAEVMRSAILEFEVSSHEQIGDEIPDSALFLIRTIPDVWTYLGILLDGIEYYEDYIKKVGGPNGKNQITRDK